MNKIIFPNKIEEKFNFEKNCLQREKQLQQIYLVHL